MRYDNPLREYNENGVLVKEYIRQVTKVGNGFYINLPIEFVRANKLSKTKKAIFILKDKYNQLIIAPLENEKS